MRYVAVGQEHELLYKVVGLFHHLEVDPERFAVFVEFEFGFVAFERYGAVLEPCGPHLYGQAVKSADLLGEVALAGLYHLLGLFVGETAVG